MREDDGFGSDTLRQDTVHHRRLARHWACDRSWGRARGRQRCHSRQDSGAQSNTSGNDLLRREGDREGRRQGAASDGRRSGEAQVGAALDKTFATFGRVDIVVNNASAISITNSKATDMKRFDLMHQINARGTFMVSKFAVPFLEKSDNPHILMLSPPLDLK